MIIPYWFKALILSLLIVACAGPNGKLHQVGNLEIYYTEKVEIAYVKALDDFFVENELIHPSVKHSIKLTSTPNEFVLKMILNDSLKKVPVDMLKDIEYLEAAIADKVFKNLNFAIVITDAYFNPIIDSKN